MLKELIRILRGHEPLAAIRQHFEEMFQLAYENTLEAGEIFFGRPFGPEDRTRIYEKDVRINKLERAIRKEVVSHLSMTDNTADVPYGLLMMSIVKDVERIGDYAKNLCQVGDLGGAPIPEGELGAELMEIRRQIEAAFKATIEIFDRSDAARALDLLRAGRNLSHRCDAFLKTVASAECNGPVTVSLVLGTRFYKRIVGHVLNVLSSVVMPLHKIDYYDEDAITSPGVGPAD